MTACGVGGTSKTLEGLLSLRGFFCANRKTTIAKGPRRIEGDSSWLPGRAFLCLTYSYMGMYCWFVARASTTSDAFNAVAEPRRREILNFLAWEEGRVGDVGGKLGAEHPSVSKHLRVLREVGLVGVRREGRKMLY